MFENKYLNNLNKGIYFINKGDYNKSIKIFDYLIKLNKNCIDVYYNKGIAHQLLFQYQKAIEYFNKCLSINRNHINSIISIGIIYCKLGNYIEGIEQFDKAINLDQNKTEALMNKAIALKNIKKYEESLIYLDKLIKINDNNSLFYNIKGNILINLGRYEESIELYKYVTLKNPNNFETFYNMGICYLNLKKYKDSNFCFDSALKIKPNMIEALIGKSLIEYEKKNYKNSIIILNKILELYPNKDIIFYKKSICLQKIKQFEEALICIDKALKINSSNIKYLLEKTKLLDILDKKDEAIHFIDNIFVEKNKSKYVNKKIIEECHLLKGSILLEKGKNEASKEFDDVIKINSNNSKAYFYKGYIQAIEDKNYREALKYFLKSVSLDKTNYLALYNIGLILLKEGKFEECKSYFIKAYEINQKFFKSLLRLGDANFKQGQYNKAMQCYDKILKEDPNDELTLIKKGDILLHLDNITEALKYYEKVLKLNEYNEEALLGKGVCNYKINNIKEGIIFFDKVLEINKENKNAIFNKAITLFNSGEKKLLKKFFRNSGDNNENIFFLYTKGLFLFREKYYNLAIEYFDKCLQKSRIKSDILYHKGLSFYENQKYDLAINCFNEALKENPNSANILNTKAIVLEKIQADKKESLELFKKVSESNPENALYLMNYCISLFDNNYYEKCKEFLIRIELLCKIQSQMDLLGQELIKSIKNSIALIYNKLNNLYKNKSYRPVKPIRKIEKPIGLYNINLNCYMNSVIQCLFHITKFSEYFISEEFSKEDQPISCELKNIFKKLKNRNGGKPFNLKEFKDMMGEYDDSFLGSNGADAADLLNYIFSLLSAENYDDINLNCENETLDESKESDVFKEALKISNPNCINNIFYIYNESTYICKNKHITYSFDYGSVLEFNIIDINEKIKNRYKKVTKKISLNDCFIYNNTNSDKYEFLCSKCQNYSFGHLKTNIFMTKEYLIIILNYGKNNGLNLKVIYDEYINIEEFVKNGNKEFFKLIGIVFHYGDSSAYGHYVAYCRNKVNNTFYNFNDSNVKISNFENILNDEVPYILFYEKYYNQSNNYIKYKFEKH